MKVRKKIIRIISLVLTFLLFFSTVTVALENGGYYGDINHDGKITSSDARGILRIAAMIDKISDEEFIYADTNRDGEITSSDARKTLRVAAMLEMAIDINSIDDEAEKEKIKNLSTFTSFQVAGKYSAIKNLANNFLIFDIRKNKTPFEINAERHDVLENNYNIFITDTNINKTFTVTSDNEHLIIFLILDDCARATKLLNYTEIDDVTNYYFLLASEEAVEELGYWVWAANGSIVREREKIEMTKECAQRVNSFSGCFPSDTIKVEYPRADCYINETRNIIIIDNRSIDKRSEIKTSCKVGPESGLLQECLIFSVRYEDLNGKDNLQVYVFDKNLYIVVIKNNKIECSVFDKEHYAEDFVEIY